MVSERKEARHMADDGYDQASEGLPPGPDPALHKLDRFVGSWEVRGRTLGAEQDDVSGRLTFEWLPGGFFLAQRVEFEFQGLEIRGLEVIGYDPATGRFPSTVFSNLVGVPIPYEYDVRGDEVTIRTELGGGATFTGQWAEGGESMSGGWRPDPGSEGAGNVAYDISGRRTG
jgi:Protein of unknown function (DUF1579)